ncbi:hypothetical protein ACT453_51995, partial [Bacillus sp. D-CC]
VSSRNNQLIKEVVGEMEKYANFNHNISFKNQNYFGGISDLSNLYPIMAYCLQVNSLNLMDSVSSRNNQLIKEVVGEMEKYANFNHN